MARECSSTMPISMVRTMATDPAVSPHAVTAAGPANAGGALLRMLQLASPALPVGAYAYSQGLEAAVELGLVRDEPATGSWLRGLLGNGLAYLDLPVLARLWAAHHAADTHAARRWNGFLLASRETRELRAEERDLGAAMARLCRDLGVPLAVDGKDRTCTFASGFAAAACHWGVDQRGTLTAYAWSWLENQVAAAQRLVPIGHTAGQRILLSLGAALGTAVDCALTLIDDQLGAAAPGQIFSSMHHERQHTRLFRS